MPLQAYYFIVWKVADSLTEANTMANNKWTKTMATVLIKINNRVLDFYPVFSVIRVTQCLVSA